MASSALEGPNGASLGDRSKGDKKMEASTEMKDVEVTESVNDEDVSKPRKTFGRTPDGTIFVVPQTHDMVSTLLSPRQPKNLSDILILVILAIHIILLFLLPPSLQPSVLGCLFVLWRTSYNFGIGYLLRNQSNHKRLVWWARKSGIFDAKRNPRICALVKHEIEAKISDEVKSGDYVFEETPIEYNTWLVFRRVVDLVLMCDFVSYVLFAISCAHVPAGEGWGLTAGRWVGGIVLFMFNLWVKLDAHRVVKDYAWYWGDFFFLIDQNLTFDGVFEMAPHPMYSVGYAGYYGISLIAASYPVLFISLAAHAAQFVFLSIVENPHIDKTYNTPAPRRRSTPPPTRPLSSDGKGSCTAILADDYTHAVKERRLIGKFDMFYNTHLCAALLIFYLVVGAVVTPNTPMVKVIFLLHAFGWRVWHTIGIGSILVGQSQNKAWFRHFLKFGQTREEAWDQWKGLYHVSLVMCHASFFAAGWKFYSLPAGQEGMSLFRHTLGILLLALQAWTAASIHESLGEFGWFFGDFFFEQPTPHLTYSGIYRYLNNPERLIGSAGIWGMVLITSSQEIFMLGLFSHVCLLLFIQFVERPHMEKLYGGQIRKEAGVVKTIKKAMPPPVADGVKSFQGSIDKALADVGEFIEEFLETARPKLAHGVMGVVKDTQLLISHYPARLSLTFLADGLADYDAQKYSIAILNAVRETKGGVATSLSVPFGQPIRIAWTAPVNHSRLDWIGLYRIADNASREVTKIASMGRWTALCRDEYDTDIAEKGIISTDIKTRSPEKPNEEVLTGELEFGGDKIFWSNGVYEFRYHHDGKHKVMAISLPFEVIVNKAPLAADQTEEENFIDMQEMQESVEKYLFPVVVRCFDRDQDIAPGDVADEFGGLGDEKYAKRIVYAVKEMFGVDFAPEVVQADGNVRRLAWRICNAKRAPFSMNTSGTPSSAPER
ncbi:phosphatidylethanolamine N-methyltransferase [Tuber magnatum]|uniref:Phosphatidylethanolamine N-methyltransferase n=1 Tax=Tuber magnatum TaxID=42249 RepID=A0A317SDJ8_9PEZI|nr:phosphatidylethanolamine N-methyltransferase [Tuber magnatum]